MDIWEDHLMCRARENHPSLTNKALILLLRLRALPLHFALLTFISARPANNDSPKSCVKSTARHRAKEVNSFEKTCGTLAVAFPPPPPRAPGEQLQFGFPRRSGIESTQAITRQ